MSDGFIPIQAIFYAIFHPIEGTKVVHQVPEHSIHTKNDTQSDPLFDFDTVKNYVIPKPQLCNKLISFKVNKYKVVGYPVTIENPRYSRNSFNFNFCFVFPYDYGDVKPYEPAITWIGKMFAALEEQSFLLSKSDKSGAFFKEKQSDPGFVERAPGHSKTKHITLSSIESLIHQIYQDLNHFSECCIPLDSANSIDIKLFPILPPPVNVKAFQVPHATVKLNQLVDVNWDPTMTKIIPHINGLNSIKRISELADSNYILTKQCIQHLMHYKCIEISDIFQFSAIYAPTNRICDFLRPTGTMAEDCQAYVVTQQSVNGSQIATPVSVSAHASSHSSPGFLSTAPVSIPSKSVLFYLYRSLNQGQTVKEWFVQHRKLLTNIDVRRFIHFGIMRGIIYRVHSYPILDSIARAVQNDEPQEYDSLVDDTQKEKDEDKKKVVFSRNVSSDSDSSYESDSSEESDSTRDEGMPELDMVNLFKMLRGYQHLDAICTELGKSRVEVERMIGGMGTYSMINS